MTRYVVLLMRAVSITRAIGRGGAWNWDVFWAPIHRGLNTEQWRYQHRHRKYIIHLYASDTLILICAFSAFFYFLIKMCLNPGIVEHAKTTLFPRLYVNLSAELQMCLDAEKRNMQRRHCFIVFICESLCRCAWTRRRGTSTCLGVRLCFFTSAARIAPLQVT
jgi:hypothetical protein